MIFNPLVLLVAGALAHPGGSHEISDETRLARRNFVDFVKREGGSCHTLARRGIEIAEKHRDNIAILRREIQAKKLEKRADANTNDAPRFETLDHHSNRKNITLDIPLNELFTSDEATCLLQPEVTNGPYYVTGEFIRDDVTDGQEGVPLYISADFYNVRTCEPVPNLWWEIWHCNAVGIYSGIQSETNGDGRDFYNETYLRGIQQTDENGAATFKTIFPGHYVGRAVHIHVMVHDNVTVYENGTLGSGSAAYGRQLHNGQFYFDQDLITEVETQHPYNTNEQELEPNTSDFILKEEEEYKSLDPFVKWVKLGDDISDGVYAWIAIGIDPRVSYPTYPAAYYDAEGGHFLHDYFADVDGSPGPGTGTTLEYDPYPATGTARPGNEDGPSNENSPTQASETGTGVLETGAESVPGTGASSREVPSVFTFLVILAGSIVAAYM